MVYFGSVVSGLVLSYVQFPSAPVIPLSFDSKLRWPHEKKEGSKGYWKPLGATQVLQFFLKVCQNYMLP